MERIWVEQGEWPTATRAAALHPCHVEGGERWARISRARRLPCIGSNISQSNIGEITNNNRPESPHIY